MSQQFGWFKNKYQSGGGATFTPNVNLNEVITANGFQYQAIITSNIPNATIKYDMTGTILTTEIEDGLTTANITLDTNGAFTLIKDFNTVVSANTHTFSLALANPNNDAVFASGNTITLSGTINKRIDVVNYTGSTLVKSNATVGSDTYTVYQLQDTGAHTFNITSVAVEKEIQMFSVGGGGGSVNNTNSNMGGGGGGGGHLYTANITTTDALLKGNAIIGQGGAAWINTGISGGSLANLSGNGSIINIHNSSDVFLAGAGMATTFVGGITGTISGGTAVTGGAGGGQLSGGGGGYAKTISGTTYAGNEQYSSPPYVFTRGGYSLGGSTQSEFTDNYILSGGTNSNLGAPAGATGIGNVVPLSYANTTTTGNAIIAELAGGIGSLSIGGIANVALGGIDFLYDFTGSNVSYGGGGSGEGDNSQTGRLRYNGFGSGGHSNTPGANGVVMLRHLQNGTRALSMS